MLILAYRGRTPLRLSDGEGVVGVTTTHKNITEKKIRKWIGGGVKITPILIRKVEKSNKKKEKIIFPINFLFIYLHISKLFSTFASQ